VLPEPVVDDAVELDPVAVDSVEMGPDVDVAVGSVVVAVPVVDGSPVTDVGAVVAGRVVVV
jgi:hypothetical protein